MADIKPTRRERRRKQPRNAGLSVFVRENSQSLLFVVVFAIAATVLLSLLRTEFAAKWIAAPLERATAICAKGIINLFGMGAKLDSTNAIRTPGFGFRIIDWCTALKEMAIWFAAILGFPTRGRTRVVGILSGWVAIFCLNVVRIALLFFIGVHHKELFIEAHSYVAQITFIVALFAGYLVWAERALGGDSSYGRVIVRTVVVFCVVFVAVMLIWLRILAPYGKVLAVGENAVFDALEHPRKTECMVEIPPPPESDDVLAQTRRFPVVKAMCLRPIEIGGRTVKARVEGIDTVQISVNMVTMLALVIALPTLTWKRRLLALGIGALAIYLYHLFMLYALVQYGYAKLYSGAYGALPPGFPIPPGFESAMGTWKWVRDLTEDWKHIVPFIFGIGLLLWLRPRRSPRNPVDENPPRVSK